MASTYLAGVACFVDVGGDAKGFQDGVGLGGLVDGLDGVVNNEGDLADGVNPVATGHDKGREGTGGKGTARCEQVCKSKGGDSKT